GRGPRPSGPGTGRVGPSSLSSPRLLRAGFPRIFVGTGCRVNVPRRGRPRTQTSSRETTPMPPVDPNAVLMTGENSFIRLSPDGGTTLSDRASHWRGHLWPARGGHAQLPPLHPL